jgi:hypothetical protein
LDSGLACFYENQATLKPADPLPQGLFFGFNADLRAAPMSVFGPIHLGADQYRPLHSFHSAAFIIAAMRAPSVRRYVVRRLGFDRRLRSKTRLFLV